jgi:LPPG:FO 2-phospho-L-lactate transferase
MTHEGMMEFQRYFVERRCAPEVMRIEFDRIKKASPTEEVRRALRPEGLDLIVICPSNPYLSIDPILQIPGMSEAIRAAGAPVIAVSPIIGGESIKGPTKKLMDELGIPVTTQSIAAHYGDLIDGLVVDVSDEKEDGSLGIGVCATQTLMKDRKTKRALAQAVVDFGAELRPEKMLKDRR